MSSLFGTLRGTPDALRGVGVRGHVLGIAESHALSEDEEGRRGVRCLICIFFSSDQDPGMARRACSDLSAQPAAWPHCLLIVHAVLAGAYWGFFYTKPPEYQAHEVRITTYEDFSDSLDWSIRIRTETVSRPGSGRGKRR